jgi:hypothetical protein
MLKKKPALIITFATTTQAMAMESFCARENLPGRLIPVPREITAGCGLSWKARPEEQERLLAALQQAGMKWAERYLIQV